MNDKIAKRVYVGECASSRFVGKPRKRLIDTVNDCFKIKKRFGYDASNENGRDL